MSFGIEQMKDYQGAINRVEAWYNGEVLDRVPVRFAKSHMLYDESVKLDRSKWETLKARWFDAEYQVDKAIADLENISFRAETFPVLWPNFGTEVYGAFYGMELEFSEITAWAKPALKNAEDIFGAEKLVFSEDNPYYQNILEQTKIALEKCKHRYIVGLTSWSTGIDTVAGWIDPEDLCKDILTYPEAVHNLLKKSQQDFREIYDKFYNLISIEHGHPSTSWLAVPTISGKSHIMQADFSSLISTELFDEFCKPSLQFEANIMDRTIFHMDGKGVANHIASILELENLHAIQWEQGLGADAPIMQWVGLIKLMQAHGKSVIAYLTSDELEHFISEITPEGIFLCISATDNVQDDILERLLRWK